ncbi:mRNA-binding protein nab2 [Cryptotrichosporon argae]
MAQTGFSQDQSAQLQAEIQTELERREWAESNDHVMAEYITVMLDRIQTEMDDLVGSDFDPAFLDWLFALADDLRRPALAEPERAAPVPRAAPARMFASAIEGTKRKYDEARDEQNKRRVSDGPREYGRELLPPSGPAAGRELLPLSGPRNGPSLGNRLGPRRGLNVRGAAPMRPMGFRQQPQQQPFGMMPGFAPYMPGQQEMMLQMMAMQANMAQMAEQMNNMAQQQPAVRPPAPVRPTRPPPPAKIPPGTKLGQHAVSTIPPKLTSGPIPDKPTSKALCKYSVGCGNARCPYSHPSPAGDESALVLSDEACAAGKSCKDPDCTKSHVSPAAVLGGSAGPSRMLCKYQNCINPTCQYRHEDAAGNAIPPPGLTAIKSKARPAPSSDGEDDVEVVVSAKRAMDGVLSDIKVLKACRYGEKCTRADCKFTHPAGRKLKGAPMTGFSASDMPKSKKFASGAELNPAAASFTPAAAVDGVAT